MVNDDLLRNAIGNLILQNVAMQEALKVTGNPDAALPESSPGETNLDEGRFDRDKRIHNRESVNPKAATSDTPSTKSAAKSKSKTVSAKASVLADPNIELARDGSITWEAWDEDRGPFSIAVGDAGGDADPHMYNGYNVLPRAHLVNPNDRGLIWGIEADYDDGSGNNKMESYVQYQHGDGFDSPTGDANYVRPFMHQLDKVTNLPTVHYLASAGSGFRFGWCDGTGTTEQQVVGKLKLLLTNTIMQIFNTPGGSNVALSIDSTSSTPQNGLSIRSTSASGGIKLKALSSGAHEAVYIDGKGQGQVVLNQDGGGPVLFPDGTVALPGIGFLSDQNCGLYRIGADDIAIAVGGAKVAEFSSSTGVTLKKPSILAATLLNSWSNLGGSLRGAGYYQTADGMVHLCGSIKGGTVGQPVFNLPAGMRPSASLYVPATNPYAATNSFIIQIKSNGDVVPLAGSNTGCSLDAVHFLAEI